MSASDVKKVYEIREGTEVLGQFSVKAKALSFKKECSSEGRKVKILVRLIKDSDRRPEPKPIPKRIPEKPKEVPKKVVKTVPKDVPRPAPKKAAPRDDPGKPRPVPEPRASKPVTACTEAVVSGRTLKSLAKLFKPLGISNVPIHASSFYVIDPAHVAMIGITNPDGRSLFGLDGDGPIDVGVDLQELAGRCSVSSFYKARDESLRLVLDDGMNPVSAGIIGGLVSPKRPKITMCYSYVVDPVSFDAELRRVKGIINGGKTSGDPFIRLYGKDGDLMMTASGDGYGFRADVGDGDETRMGSLYAYSYLKALAEMFLMSESVCTMTMDDEYPLEAECTVGGLRLAMLIAPRMEE